MAVRAIHRAAQRHITLLNFIRYRVSLLFHLLLPLRDLLDVDIEVGVLALWLIFDRLIMGPYEAALGGQVGVLEVEDLKVILPRAQDLM